MITKEMMDRYIMLNNEIEFKLQKICEFFLPEKKIELNKFEIIKENNKEKLKVYFDFNSILIIRILELEDFINLDKKNYKNFITI